MNVQMYCIAGPSAVLLHRSQIDGASYGVSATAGASGVAAEPFGIEAGILHPSLHSVIIGGDAQRLTPFVAWHLMEEPIR